jgi:hypothetical protein
MQGFRITVTYRLLDSELGIDARLDRAAEAVAGKACRRQDFSLRDRGRSLSWIAWGKPRALRAVQALTELFTRTPRRRDDPVRKVTDWAVDLRPHREPSPLPAAEDGEQLRGAP